MEWHRRREEDRGTPDGVSPEEPPGGGDTAGAEPPADGSTDAELARADAVFDEAVKLSLRPGHEDGAEQQATAAVAAYQALQVPDDHPAARDRKRRLARALWRQSTLVALHGRPVEALKNGRAGVRLALDVLDNTPVHDPLLDELEGEAAIAMNDLSEVAAAAGRLDEQRQLQDDVIARCGRHRGGRARQQLGTALHNRAVAIAFAADHPGAGAAASGQAGADLRPAIDLVNLALALRRELLDVGQPVTYWELASSLLLRGRLRENAGEPGSGAADLLEAWKTLESTKGPSVDVLRSQVRATMVAVEARSPQIVRGLDWPWAPGTAGAATADVNAAGAAAMARATPLIEAHRWREAAAELEPAAEAGSGMAMHALGLVLAQFDRGKATRWFERAAEAGRVESDVVLGQWAAEAGRVDEAERRLRAAVAAGDADGMFHFGMLLFQHRGLVAEGMAQWERAAARNHTLAALNLGNASLQQGRPADAERWFRRGAELGDIQAMFNLAFVLSGTGRAAESAQWHERGLAAERAQSAP